MSEQLNPQAATAAVDSGLGAVVMLLRYHGIGGDLGQIGHRFGGVNFGVAEILRCAKEFGLRARVFATDWARLSNTSLPGIAALKDGNFLILGKVGDGKVLVQAPGSPKPAVVNQAEFEDVWDGRVVLMTRRAALGDLDRRFNISWFLGAIRKYRGLLSEVLLASFFLQVFALVAPQSSFRSSSTRYWCIVASAR
jgi:subfamily B ATP-binding cassette protein HlyB/CyaB